MSLFAALTCLPPRLASRRNWRLIKSFLPTQRPFLHPPAEAPMNRPCVPANHSLTSLLRGVSHACAHSRGFSHHPRTVPFVSGRSVAVCGVLPFPFILPRGLAPSPPLDQTQRSHVAHLPSLTQLSIGFSLSPVERLSSFFPWISYPPADSDRFGSAEASSFFTLPALLKLYFSFLDSLLQQFLPWNVGQMRVHQDE